MKTLSALLLLIAAGPLASAQVYGGARGAPYTTGTSVPASCVPLSLFLKTDTKQLYYCGASNTFEPAGYLSDIAANRPATCNTGQLFVATDTPAVSACGPANMWNPLPVSMQCDGVTDVTASLNSTLSALNTAGGGTLTISGKCIVLGQINLPFGAATTYVMNPIRITGATSSRGFSDHPVAPEPGSAAILDMQFNGNRLQSFGQGTLEIDHLTIQNTGSNCGTFLVTTHTNVMIHDNTFWGHASGASACDDVWQAGGSSTPMSGWLMTANDYFQGYASYMVRNFADQIRRLVSAGVAFNGITISSNVIGNRSGSNLTASITAATNANPAVLTTASSFGLPVGSTFKVSLSGFTGTWTSLNANFTATLVSGTTFSVPVNSTTFGALTGSPVYPNGAAIEINGFSDPTDGDQGNAIANNLIEMQHYAYGVKMLTAGGTSNSGQGNMLSGNECFDGIDGPVAVACYRFEADSQHNYAQASYYNAIALMDDVNGGNHSPVVGDEALSNPIAGLNAIPAIATVGSWPSLINSGVYWDATHTRFGVFAAPRVPFDIQCSGGTTDCYLVVQSAGGANGMRYGQDQLGNGYVWLRDNHTLFFGTNDGTAMQINGNHTAEFKTSVQFDTYLTSALASAGAVGGSIASAATIAPTAPVTHITGTTQITTITAPSQCATSGFGCQLTLIPDGLWTTGTSGNIAIATTAVVSKALVLTYDNATAKWYPSY